MEPTKSRVAVVRCGSYERAEVEQAVRRGLGLLGGMDRFVRPGERIVVKPNVLYGAPPSRCVATHPEVFRAVAACAQKAGATVLYGDSSAVLPPALNLRTAGLSAVADELGLTMADFVTPVEVAYPGALIAHRLAIAKGVVEADGLISACKMKTHGLTRFTGAVKNQFGCVPGAHKGRYHAQYPSIDDFCKLLADVCAYVKPRLAVMDGVIAMEGNGPGSGTPRTMGVILLSDDMVALDCVACRLIDLPAEYVPTIAYGQQAGLGTAERERIELVGDAVEPLIQKTFDVPRRPPVRLERTGIRRVLRELLVPRPVIRHSRCVRCGRCIEVCPVEPKAVNWGSAGKSNPPRHQYSDCIRCFCCNEVCPEKAIDVVTPLVGRLAPWASFLSLLLGNLVVRMKGGRNRG
jgi:uncharacterized protein (DUF362 family)/NAD-dependent dihydropyrimidine dehydrogenase PreA subunit